jgi:U4/U6.U5 tri-snRNP-associated protein 1
MASPTDIEQMNKLRKSLGLPLLNVSGQPPPTSEEGPSFKSSTRNADNSDDESEDGEPASTLETREAAGYENWNKVQEDERRRVEREKRKKEIQRKRDLEARDRVLEGKGLGDIDENELDTKAWLRGQKKRQSKIERERAERLERELADREREAAVQYTAKDLAGVQVAHEIGDFEDGTDEQILTLQDKEIGKGDDSDDEDVLENAALVAKDKLKDKLDLKKKKKVYDVNDDSEQGLLAQYDDKKRKAFILDAQGSSLEERESKRQQIGEKLKNTISLDILKEEPISDYLELKIKKPKKEKKKSKRQRLADEDEEEDFATGTNGDAMDVDTGAPTRSGPTSRTAEDNFNDDDDLAKALARSRQKMLKKQKRRPEDIIKQLKEEEEQEAVANGAAEGGIVLDETTVFLDNLRPRSASPEQAVKRTVEQEDSESPPAARQESEDQVMAGMEDENEVLERVKRERSAATPEVSARGLEEEKTLDQGLGAALGLLKQRGLIKETDADSKNQLYKDRQQFIINARLRENENEQRARMQRERDRQSGKFSTMSAKEREEHARWQNSQREHQSSIQAAATFNREYKPDVQIKYVDDDGRLMNQKEAFKHLSHQFHGKGSGKLKTEKHLKKIEEEKKREATSVLDSSKATGMNNAGGFMGKKNREAGVRLQ